MSGIPHVHRVIYYVYVYLNVCCNKSKKKKKLTELIHSNVKIEGKKYS